jgi:hypothetical protein
MHGMDRNKNFGGDATSGPMAAMMRRVKGIIAYKINISIAYHTHR